MDGIRTQRKIQSLLKNIVYWGQGRVRLGVMSLSLKDEEDRTGKSQRKESSLVIDVTENRERSIWSTYLFLSMYVHVSLCVYLCLYAYSSISNFSIKTWKWDHKFCVVINYRVTTINLLSTGKIVRDVPSTEDTRLKGGWEVGVGREKRRKSLEIRVKDKKTIKEFVRKGTKNIIDSETM